MAFPVSPAMYTSPGKPGKPSGSPIRHPYLPPKTTSVYLRRASFEDLRRASLKNPSRRLCSQGKARPHFLLFVQSSCMMMGTRSSPWPDLQPELLGLVLKRLPSLADRVRLRAVCRTWRCNARLEPLPPLLPWVALFDRTLAFQVVKFTVCLYCVVPLAMVLWTPGSSSCTIMVGAH
jgi:hypothetical protein